MLTERNTLKPRYVYDACDIDLFVLFRHRYFLLKIRRNVIDVSYHIAQYQQIIQDLRSQVHLLRDQKDDLEVRLASTNEARFSRLSGKTMQSRRTFVDNHANERLRMEEGLKLKESILQAYRKQIDARRALLDIDSGLMDVVHEHTRNESIIQQYVSMMNSIDRQDVRIHFGHLVTSRTKRTVRVPTRNHRTR
jgi:hypothetical protein